MPRPASLSDAQLRRTREAAQLLDRSRRRKPFDVVRHLLGVQAQVLPAAGLALASRSDGLTAETVMRAREKDRSIVHTWAMRGTLHLITAEDYGWLVPLVLEPRIANSLRRLRQLGYSGDKPEVAARTIEGMLESEGPLTRQEVLRGLRRRRFPTEDVTISYHLLWLANSTGGVCYGPTRKGQRCFVLFRDWVGEPRRMDPDAALAELVVRYLASHGPARPEDLAFWSGLRLTDIRRGWHSVEDRLVEVEASGTPMWRLRRGAGAAPAGLVRLLPNFDEYFLGWKDRGFSVEPERWKLINQGGGWLHPVVLADGRAAGLWKAERSPKAYRIKLEAFDSLPATVRRKVDREAARLESFLGLPVGVGQADGRMTEPLGVELREVRESDLEVFFVDQADQEAARMAAFASRDRDRFLEHWQANVLADPGGVIRTILAGGEVAGNIVIFDGPTGREVGYWIGRRFWGRGVATGALSALLHEVDERPIWAHVAKHNPGSLRVLQKCGFEIVGEGQVDDVDEFVLRLDAAGA